MHSSSCKEDQTNYRYMLDSMILPIQVYVGGKCSAVNQKTILAFYQVVDGGVGGNDGGGGGIDGVEDTMSRSS